MRTAPLTCSLPVCILQMLYSYIIVISPHRKRVSRELALALQRQPAAYRVFAHMQRTHSTGTMRAATPTSWRPTALSCRAIRMISSSCCPSTCVASASSLREKGGGRETPSLLLPVPGRKREGDQKQGLKKREKPQVRGRVRARTRWDEARSQRRAG